MSTMYHTLILSSKPSFLPYLLCSLISKEFHFRVSEECCLACLFNPLLCFQLTSSLQLNLINLVIILPLGIKEDAWFYLKGQMLGM